MIHYIKRVVLKGMVARAIIGVPLVAGVAGEASAVNFSWNVNTNGAFNNSANWLQTSIGSDADGVPDADDAITFRRGSGTAYSVTFPGLLGAPVSYVTDRLLIGSNSVTLADAAHDAASTYVVNNATTAETGRGIVIGAGASDTAAVLTSRLPTFSGVAATIGDVTGSNGTLNVTAGTFKVAGSDASNIELIVGRSGTGALNVSGGAGVNVTQDAALGEYAAATGTVSVTGAGSTWTNGGNLSVGLAGNGTLKVTSGGQVSNANGYLGSQSGSIGIATVDGASSTWTSSGFLYDGYASTGTLNLTSGGQASNVAGVIGLQSGSTGLATVDGANSKWTNSSNLYVGYAGAGTLSLTNGGRVSNTDGYIGSQAGSVGTATVDGTNSIWTNNGYLFVGNSGNGTLNVSSGGQVSNTLSGYIGANAGSTSTATVTGSGSMWTNGADLYVGDLGSGTLNLNNFGQVSSTNCYVGNQTGSTGVVNVDSSGMMFGFPGLFVGNYGMGTMHLTNASHVFSNGNTYFGVLAGSVGTVTVDSSSSWLTNGDLIIGDNGTGTLDITNRGFVTNYYLNINHYTYIIAFAAGSTGTVTVAGGTLGNNGELDVGSGGHGTLSILSGGHVSNGYDENLGIGGTIAGTSGSNGVVNVNGAGSEWDAGGTLFVGLAGTGTLNITSGGVVINGSYDDNDPSIVEHGGCDIGTNAGGVGMATIDGASGWYIVGDLSVGYGGRGTLSITGGGQVISYADGYIGNQGSSIGAVAVDGTNSKWTNNGKLYVGSAGTGTLTVSNGGAVQAMTIIVGSLGEVHGNGFITGNVQNGGLVSPGNSPGVLTITGNYTQTTAGKLLIELAGTTLGTQYDQLHVSGTVTLDGTLQISLLSGFAPSSGDSVDLLTTFSGISGTFANPQLPLLAGGLVWNLSYGTNDVILSVGGVLGDYNHNGTVDAADYVVWRNGLGTTYTQVDYDVWRSHFGQTAGGGAGAVASAAVPEPTTLVLLVLAAASWCLLRSRAE